jgi:hypothetical protein
MQDLKHKLLLVLLALTIVGEIASIIIWTLNPPLPNEPSPRFTLAVDYIIAIANAAVFAALNSIAFFWIIKRNKIGAPFLIAISIINRIVSIPLFIGGAHAIFITWTFLLIIFAYDEYRGLSNFASAFLSLGAIADLAVTALLFSAVEGNAVLGLAFYLAVLAILVGIVTLIKKLRK